MLHLPFFQTWLILPFQSGIGTYTIPQVATPIYAKVSKTLDLMFANNLNHHVMSGYQFLMQNCASTSPFFLSEPPRLRSNASAVAVKRALVTAASYNFKYGVMSF